MPPEQGSPSGSQIARGPRAVLFDVDGTLVDTSYLHTLCWWQALESNGHLVSMATLHRAVGMGSDQLLDEVLDTERDRAGDERIVAGHDERFATWHEKVAALPGARALVTECACRGLAVALASSSRRDDLTAIRRVLDVDDAVDAITDSADADATKPAPDIIEAALEQLGVTPADAVLVGDSVWDVEAAARAGVACIGLECGGTSAAELLAAGAVETWKDPADLLANLSGSSIRGPQAEQQHGRDEEEIA